MVFLFLSVLAAAYRVSAASDSLGWHFVQNGTSGVLALEAMVVSPTLAIMFNRPSNDPLQVNGHPAWGALWNFETNTATALDVLTDSFCASGAFISNGTMISLGGNPLENLETVPDKDGLMGIRIFEPCLDPSGASCTLFEDPDNIHLAEKRWYPSSARIFDGSLVYDTWRTHAPAAFYNIDPANTFEFFPPKDGGVPRSSAFLERTLPTNLFPRVLALPDGKVFIAANNQSIIYDIETNTETPLPDIPNGVRITNPMDGTATLLPLSPPDYTPEVLICGGSATDDSIPSRNLSAQTPASDQCSRITLTPEGIAQGWEVEHMLEGRMMPEMILLPNGQVLITNGRGLDLPRSAASRILWANRMLIILFTPSLYTPSADVGQRISNVGLPTTDIPRMYHASVSLTPMGNIFLAGSNENVLIVNDSVKFPSEFRVEYLNPPYMTVERPILQDVPSQIGFHENFTITVDIPESLNASTVQVALMDLGFSSHAFHSSSRLVFMTASLSEDKTTLSVLSPRITGCIRLDLVPFIFVTVDDVSSAGAQVMVGSGLSPPVPDQGVSLLSTSL
ncbi:copper radical oxidase [Hymenopellis radicata]|nr:copper radical oxidase [Hymenopellis radicata]